MFDDDWCGNSELCNNRHVRNVRIRSSLGLRYSCVIHFGAVKMLNCISKSYVWNNRNRTTETRDVTRPSRLRSTDCNPLCSASPCLSGLIRFEPHIPTLNHRGLQVHTVPTKNPGWFTLPWRPIPSTQVTCLCPLSPSMLATSQY